MTAIDSRIDAAARLLVGLRASGQDRPRRLPATCSPTDEAEAYAIQRRTLQLLGVGVGGWKVAANADGTGNCAPIPATALVNSPANLAELVRAYGSAVGIEPEVALRFDRALPAPGDGPPHERDAVLEAIDAALPVVEIVTSRFADLSAAPALDHLADISAHGALVLGPTCTQWRQLSLGTLPLRMRARRLGAIVGVDVDQTGGHGLGDPLQSLLWLVAHLGRRGIDIPAGSIVTTGSCAGIRHVESGTQVEAEFAGLGALTVQL